MWLAIGAGLTTLAAVAIAVIVATSSFGTLRDSCRRGRQESTFWPTWRGSWITSSLSALPLTPCHSQ